jgi:flagellar assembly factor FliW
VPTVQTKYFGELAYSPDAVLRFPEGLLGFPGDRRFLLIEPGSQPLAFLQDIDDSTLCFPVIPARHVDPDFRFTLDPESCSVLQLPVTDAPYPQGTLLCLAIVTFDPAGRPAANLKGPVVLHVAERIGAQVVQFDGDYGLRHPVPSLDEVVSC